jgi:hypothetical protein
MRSFTIRDYTPPPGGWSEFLRRRGKEAAKRYLADKTHLLPEVRAEYLAWKRDHPEARIYPANEAIFSPFTRHRVQNPSGYPRIR